MLLIFNNLWIILLSLFLVYYIIKKIISLNKPFNTKEFIIKYKNQKKLQKKLSFDSIKHNLTSLVSYYFGLH